MQWNFCRDIACYFQIIFNWGEFGSCGQRSITNTYIDMINKSQQKISTVTYNAKNIDDKLWECLFHVATSRHDYENQNSAVVVYWSPNGETGTNYRFTLRHSVCLSVRHTRFSYFFSYMHWHIELNFHIWLPFTVIQIKFDCRNLRQYLWELCSFWNLAYRKYAVFHTFLLHSLTYEAESLYISLFYCTTDQVRVSSISVDFFGS